MTAFRQHLTASLALLLGAAALPAQVHMRPPPPRVEFPDGVDMVEIPIEIEGHLVTFEARVNESETLRFILDTGASSAVLRESAWIEKLDMEVRGEARVAGGGSGSVGTARIAGPITIDLGGLTLHRDMIVVGVGEAMSGLTWNGALGAGLLGQAVAEIDYENRRLRLHRPESFVMPADAVVVPTSPLSSGLVAVEAEVTIDGRAASHWLVVDSGAFHGLSLNAADTTLPATRVERATTIGWGTQGAMPGHIGRVDSLRLGGLDLGAQVAAFPDAAGLHAVRKLDEGDAPITGNLGSAALRRFTVIVDHPHGRLGLRPRREPPPPFNFTSTGIVGEPATTDRGLVVHDVLPGTPAAEAGLAAGDIVVALDGQPLAGMGIELRSRIIDPPPGARLRLDVERAGEPLSFELAARPLFPPAPTPPVV